MVKIFEQFMFIPKMFNTSSHKVQECGLWSVVCSFFIWLIDWCTHFTTHIIGVSVLYAFLLFLIMVADFITGIRAAKKEFLKEYPGEKWESESKKGLRWVIKYFTYIMGFFLINVITKEVTSLNLGVIADLSGINFDSIFILIFKVIKLFLMLYILRWECKSIDENLERLGYDFKIFDFFDNAVTAITSLFKSKTGIDISDKKNGNTKTN